MVRPSAQPGGGTGGGGVNGACTDVPSHSNLALQSLGYAGDVGAPSAALFKTLHLEVLTGILAQLSGQTPRRARYDSVRDRKKFSKNFSWGFSLVSCFFAFSLSCFLVVCMSLF